MKLHLKSDTYIIKILLLMLAVVDTSLVGIGIRQNDVQRSLMIALFVTVITVIVIILSLRESLYIDNDTLCYTGIRKKYYSIDDVKGLHIVKAQIRYGHFSKTDLRDFKGNYRYEIIYLKNRDFKIGREDYGNIDFYMNHKKSVLFSTAYDERVIDYFRSKGIPVTGQIN